MVVRTEVEVALAEVEAVVDDVAGDESWRGADKGLGGAVAGYGRHFRIMGGRTGADGWVCQSTL